MKTEAGEAAFAHWHRVAQEAQREVARLTAALDEAQRFAGHVYCTQEIGDLRAELRDVKAELARMTEYRDNARARLDRAEQTILAAHDLLREACALRGEPADPISGRELLAAIDRVSDETLDAIEEGTAL